MPIEFRSATPPNTQAAYQAGYVQQQSQNAARQQQAWQSAQSNSLHQQQITQQGDALRQRQDEFDASQQPSARDQYLSQQHGAQQLAGIDAQQQGRMAEVEQRMQMEFTNADKLRLQRIQQGRAGARSAYDAGELTQDEYQEYVQSLDGAQRPLEQMREYTQVQANRAMVRQREQQAQQEAVQMGTVRDFMQRSTLGPPVRVVTDPVTGESFSEVERQPNRWEPLRGGGAGGTSGSGAGGGGTTNAYFSAEQHARESHDRAELARVATSGGTPAPFDAQAFMQRYQETDATLRQSSYNQGLMSNPRANQGPLQAQEQARNTINQSVQQAIARVPGFGNETVRGDLIGLRENLGGIINLWGTRPQNQWPAPVQQRFATQMQRLAEIQQSMAAPPASGQPGAGQPTVGAGGAVPPPAAFSGRGEDVSAAQVRDQAGVTSGPVGSPSTLSQVGQLAGEVIPRVNVGGTTVANVGGIPVPIPNVGPGTTISVPVPSGARGGLSDMAEVARVNQDRSISLNVSPGMGMGGTGGSGTRSNAPPPAAEVRRREALGERGRILEDISRYETSARQAGGANRQRLLTLANQLRERLRQMEPPADNNEE